MSQIWDIYCKHCLWSIFGPCWCTKSCKTTFYAHLSRIWKLAQFTRFVRKVFATKILLFGKFSLFVTLAGVPPNPSQKVQKEILKKIYTKKGKKSPTVRKNPQERLPWYKSKDQGESPPPSDQIDAAFHFRLPLFAFSSHYSLQSLH